MADDRRRGRTRNDIKIDQMHDHDIDQRCVSRKAKERFKRPPYCGIRNLLEVTGGQIFHE